MTRVLVTGGAGFISSNLCRHLLRATDHEVVIMDALTYAGNTANIADLLGHERLAFVEGDIRDAAHVEEIVAGVDVIVNAAAESHVEKSILDGASEFVTTNVEGTQVLLDACRRHPVERFVLVSSSEVYGTAERDPMDEEHPLNPRSPYAATKAGGDRLVYSYWCTYGTPAVVVRPFNNYGPFQHPEKVIPRFITAALQDRPLTVHGGGGASRDWLHVEDTSEAIAAIIAAPLHRITGQVLNVATGVDVDVQSIAERICDSLGKPRSLIAHVPDRPGQVDRHIGSTAKTDELRRLARAHRLRRRPRAHDPLVRRQSGLVGCARGRPQLAPALGLRTDPPSSSHRARRRGRPVRCPCRGTPIGGVTVACDRDRWAFCLREGLADRFDNVSAMDLAGLLGVAQRERAAGVISPGTDGPVRVAAEVSAALGLPHPIDPAVAARATDKLEQRRAFARAGVPQPRFSEDGTGIPPGARVVVKPVAAQGQRGLAIAEPGDDVQALAATAARDSRDGRALCEEFVEGPELTVNAFMDAGRFVPLTVTDRERALAFGVATAHLYPSQHPTAAVVAAAEAACRALGIKHGPTYTQVLIGPDGPCVMEVAARLGGGHDAELCEAALGVDLSAAAVRSAVGRPAGPLARCATARLSCVS